MRWEKLRNLILRHIMMEGLMFVQSPFRKSEPYLLRAACTIIEIKDQKGLQIGFPAEQL